jgi:sugar phosphate isomerase/epimerase
MLVGVTCRADELAWVRKLGFQSMQWMAFSNSAAAQPHAEWKALSETFAAEAKDRGIRVSAIGAYYRNPLDPKQRESATALLRRAIDIAGHIGVKTVSAFAGAVIDVEMNERGGNPVYKPLENHLPEILAFWEPLARYAGERGVRIALENCPQGAWHLPIMHYNIMGQPAIWERFFNDSRSENIGLEWDAAHLICQFIDPIANIHKFGRRIFHVHAKDAYINRPLLETYGICHPGVAEHRFPGLGQANWAEIVHALVRAGYDSDLNIEGRHDPVYRDHDGGLRLEDTGLLIAKALLEPFTHGTERLSP